MKLLMSIGAVILALAIAGGAKASPAASNAHAFHVLKTESKWMKIDTKHHSVVLKIVAAYNGTNGGLNMDGYANGDANFSIPYGWKVQINWSNKSSDMNHSLGIATNHGDNLTIAKIGGKKVQTPDPMNGTASGTTVKLTFTAKPAGKYFIVCQIPGHASSGMWDSFTISKTVKTASILVR